MRLMLLIPAYNEEENIQRVVDQLIHDYPQHDYVVVNDGSAPLDTVLQELLASLPRSSAKNHP